MRGMNDALKFLTEAISMHAVHLRAPKKVTMASQREMMVLMKKAKASLQGRKKFHDEMMEDKGEDMDMAGGGM